MIVMLSVWIGSPKTRRTVSASCAPVMIA